MIIGKLNTSTCMYYKNKIDIIQRNKIKNTWDKNKISQKNSNECTQLIRMKLYLKTFTGSNS